MTDLAIVGGVYGEDALWPEWHQLFGSAGRASAALSGHVAVELFTYARSDIADQVKQLASFYDFKLSLADSQQLVSFHYTHSLSTPEIRPGSAAIKVNPPIIVAARNVLRFGMLDGDAMVEAECCVYDPQSPVAPAEFGANGSKANRLAIVGNRAEIRALGKDDDALTAAHNLLARGAEVVVVKSGPVGALVVTKSANKTVPAFQTERVWTVGSGDVFAAHFASRWACHGDSPEDAATIASLAVAEYVESMALPTPSMDHLKSSNRQPATVRSTMVYLAGPFFSMGQRWVIDEALRALQDFRVPVFSPVHEVGPGPAEIVGPADLKGLAGCDSVLAIVDGLDAGTIFEIGYARAQGKPVYALAQTVASEDLKMLQGSGCRVFDDFVTAVHHAVWRT